MVIIASLVARSALLLMSSFSQLRGIANQFVASYLLSRACMYPFIFVPFSPPLINEKHTSPPQLARPLHTAVDERRKKLGAKPKKKAAKKKR
jgi:hypothetical protein